MNNDIDLSLTDIILYFNILNKDRFSFFDPLNNIEIKDIKNKDIKNIWVDYDTFDNNNIYHLIRWILKKKYSFTGNIKDINEIKDINLYKKYKDLIATKNTENKDEWDMIDERSESCDERSESCDERSESCDERSESCDERSESCDSSINEWDII
jgi:hypothetical protein